MVNLATERKDTPERSVPYVIRQFLKNKVNTSIPGIVVSYEPLTRRAVVQVALNILLTNGLALRWASDTEHSGDLPRRWRFSVGVSPTPGRYGATALQQAGYQTVQREF